MNFSRFDMILIVVMSIGIVIMSFVFPALGLIDGDAAKESEIPEFDMEPNRFDFAGDFPDRPGTPTNGQLTYDSTETQFSDNQRWLSGSDTSEGTDLVGTRNSTNNDVRVTINVWSSGNLSATDELEFSSVGDRGVLTAGEWEVRIEVVSLTADDDADTLEYTVEYEIVEQPTSGGGWLGRVPVVGTVFDAASATAGVLSWIGSIIWWFFLTAWQIALNLLGMLFDAVSFMFGTASWLITTYSAIISGADAWVSVFVGIPGLLLFLEFAKLAMIAISLLPLT